MSILETRKSSPFSTVFLRAGADGGLAGVGARQERTPRGNQDVRALARIIHVILSVAKNLFCPDARSFAALRMTEI
jgi:hypothetical protein